MNVKILLNQQVRNHLNIQRGLLVLTFFLFSALGAQAQTVTSDKDDYAPGEVAIITGTGWTNDQFVDVHFVETPAYHEEHQHDYHGIAVDADGNWEIRYQIEDRHIGVAFDVYVVGIQSGATAHTYFTDGILQTVTVGSQFGSATQGTISTVNYFVKLSRVESGTESYNLVVTGLPTRATYTFTTNPLQVNGNAPAVATTTLTISTSAANSAASSPYSFEVKATNIRASGDSKTGSGTLTIVPPANSAPVANEQTVTTNEDAAKAITLTGSDADGNALTYSIITGPAHGTFVGGTYTPAANYHGSDAFTFKANDGTEDSAPATVSITVNAVNDVHVVSDIKAPTDPIAVTTDIKTIVRANFTDVDFNANSYTAIWNWGNGTFSAGLVTGADGVFKVTVKDSYFYPAAGVYTVTVTVTDDKNISVTSAPFEYLVIFDPSAGFVTGGGFINSPAGALVGSQVTGKAQFGFVSNYEKGANKPTGNTQLQYHTGDFLIQKYRV